MPEAFENLSRDGVILDVRGEMSKRTRLAQRVAHQVGRLLASPWSLVLLGAIAGLWMLANTGWFPWRAWDPYPFALLGTIYSVLSPSVAVLILMRQHRDLRIAELRDEVTLQVLLHAEHKTTALLQMIESRRRSEEPPFDREYVQKLLEEIDPEHLVQSVNDRLERDEKRD